MFLRMRNVGIGTHLVLAAGALFGLSGQALADGPDVGISIRIGSPVRVVSSGHHHHHHHHDYAGTLTIDGRSFHIDADRSVRWQIRRAFERMGYDAWYVGGSVRVRTGHCSPEVCWRNGEYSMMFRERRGSITLTPDDCDDHYHGRHYRYGFDAGRGHYFAYNEVEMSGGGTSWTSMGATAFVDNDRDLDDELRVFDRRGDSGRRDDSDGGGRYQPDEHRFERRDDAREGSKIDDRSSRPAQPRVDDRKRTDITSRKPVTTKPEDLKRTTPAPAVIDKDKVKALPADRLGDLKRDAGAKPRQEVKPSAPVKKDDAKAAQSRTPAAKPASKGADDKKSKW